MKHSMREVAHEIAQDLYQAGVIDAVTLREFDPAAIPPVRALTPRQIKLIRIKQKVSQAVFARYLNTSISTVKQWEQGEKHPSGLSLRLLNLVSTKGLTILL